MGKPVVPTVGTGVTEVVWSGLKRDYHEIGWEKK
jgi:hypothetical protein